MSLAPRKLENDKEPLRVGFSHLTEATEEAIALTKGDLSSVRSGRQLKAMAVYRKLIAHNKVMLGLARQFLDDPDAEEFLDHYSILTMARASIDAALMTMYISEPTLTLLTWDFRLQLLCLQEINNRSRYFKPLRKKGVEVTFFENYEESKQVILDNIRKFGAALHYDEQAVADYQKGSNMFVDGARGAVREAGWDVPSFDFYQSYFSAFVHSHPVSFFDFQAQGIKSSGASDYQISVCGFALAVTAAHTKPAVDRMSAIVAGEDPLYTDEAFDAYRDAIEKMFPPTN